MVSVKSSGGDYSSLSSAEAGEQGDLVSLDRQLDIECYSMNDSGANVTVNGWTTDATRYLRIYAAAGERHAGAWSTSKYRISRASGAAPILTVSEDYVRLEGLQIEDTDATFGQGSIQVSSTAAAASSDIRIDSCIFRAGGTRGAVDSYSTVYIVSGKTTIRNTLIYGNALNPGVFSTFGSNSPTVNIDNCTITGCGSYGLKNGSGTWTVRNVYSGGHGTDSYNGTMTRTTCAHSTATSFAGSTASVAHSAANFTNVTGGSEDYHLVSGSALIDAGTDLSGTFTTDINGATRSAPWDIGADEFAGGGATGQPTWRRFGGVAYGRAPVGVHGVGVY